PGLSLGADGRDLPLWPCCIDGWVGRLTSPVPARKGAVDPLIALAVFPIIFSGELPEKTMFASLVMATRGKPRQVWLGAAGAFLVHVVIAVTLGLAIFALLPHRAVEGIVTVMFLFGAVYAWREGAMDEEEVAEKEV